MIIPAKIRTFCPKCNAHTLHIVKLYRKGKARALAKGTVRFERKLKGYTGKVAGKVPVAKRGKKQKVLLECEVCKHKIERVVGARTQKVLELKKGQ